MFSHFLEDGQIIYRGKKVLSLHNAYLLEETPQSMLLQSFAKKSQFDRFL